MGPWLEQASLAARRLPAPAPPSPAGYALTSPPVSRPPSYAQVRTKGLFSFYEDGHGECCRVRKVGGCRARRTPLAAAPAALFQWLSAHPLQTKLSSHPPFSTAAGPPAAPAADGPARLDHGAAQGPEPRHAPGGARSAGGLPYFSFAVIVFLLPFLFYYQRDAGLQNLAVGRGACRAAGLGPPACTTRAQSCVPLAFLPPQKVDPVFEGLNGGAGSLVKYNPLSNVTSQEVWNFLRVMVRTGARRAAGGRGGGHAGRESQLGFVALRVPWRWVCVGLVP